MIVVCPACSARFQYDESRFQGAGSKRFKCPKCDKVFEVANPALAAPAAREALPVTAVHAAIRDLPPLAPPVPVVFQPAAGPDPAPQGVRSTLMGSTHARMPGMPRNTRFTLAFLTGPRASTVRVLDTQQTDIGREEGDIITQDPESSRRHARLEIYSDGTVWLTDLGSTNGTHVEGQRITQAYELQDRQEFTCGKSTFMLLVRHEDEHSME